MLIWRYMKIRTNMKTYSAALNGTLNLRIWGPKDTWKSEPKWKTIQLLLMRLRICKSCWSKDTWKSAQKWKTIQLLLMKLKIRESCWSKDTWKSRPKWKPFSCSYPQRMTFWSEKAWRKTQISLVKYVSLIWQSTAWRADQMLTPESFALQLLLLPAMCCQQILLCHLNTLFPNLPHAIFFKHLMLSICSYIESSWMDYLQCGFFHVSSNGLMLNIFCHWEQLNGLSLVWVLSCLFKWLDIEHL